MADSFPYNYPGIQPEPLDRKALLRPLKEPMLISEQKFFLEKLFTLFYENGQDLYCREHVECNGFQIIRIAVCRKTHVLTLWCEIEG